jgi:type I restriction enzyme S subunit
MSRYKRYERYKDSGVEWIGQVPNHWKVLKIKRLTRVKRGASPRPIDDPIYFDDDGEFSWVRISDVTTSKMYLNESTEKLSALGASLSIKLTPGQLFISICATVGKPCITKIKCCIHDGFVYFPDFKGDNRFLYYIFEAGEAYNGLGKLGTQLNLNTDTVGSITIGLPPLNEQIAIANFLDQKTAEIDGLIADKEKLIELLQEKRQAVITEAVTKGLNPNVRMKDSGIEWIGEIPEHWEVCGFTKYISSIIDYRGKTPEKVDEGVFLVTAKNIKNGRIDYSLSQEYVKSEEYEQIMRRGLPEIGDVVFTTEAPLGEVANVDRTDVAFAQRVIKFRGKVEKLDNYYLKYWIMSHGFQHDLQSYATGSTATGIKASKLSKLIILLPRLEEQKAIVNFLDQKTAEIDDLIFDIYTQIQKLKEYRQSLISEAVTGKIDVRDYVVSN